MRPPPNSGGIHPDGYATDKFYPAPAPALARDHSGQKKPVSGAYATGPLGCLLDSVLSGDDMALKVLTKVNGKLRFLYRQGKYLNKRLRRMLCNTIIQPHFDYASSAW